MLSFWEKKNFVHYDYIVVGAGITGLSTACAIKEKKPKANVLVLERGILPAGASTKNAGFACIGSFSEKLADLELMGEDAFLQLIQNRLDGLFMLRKRLGDDNIDFQNNGGFEIVMNGTEIDPYKLDMMNTLLERIFRHKIFHIMPHLVAGFGLNSTIAANIIVNPMEGQLDTGKMMKTLLNYAGILRVQIITGADVTAIDENSNEVKVEVQSGWNKEVFSFKTEKVAVCTNAFTKKFFPDLEINPGRGQVLCTSPIDNLKVKGTFSFDEGYYYFRDFENRIILGGGRNTDFEKETTDVFELNDNIQKQLDFFLDEMILPGKKYTIEQRWTGIMAFGKSKLPIVKKMSDRIVVGARLNGMGIALGSKIADQLSHMMIN